MIQLDRSYYSIHREIYEWVVKTTECRWGHGYNIMFGYQEIDLTPEQEVKFHEFIDTLRANGTIRRSKMSANAGTASAVKSED